MFEAFRNELDEHQDRRERIIKASRDITALSKKIILDLFNAISPDLHGSNAWRYQRQVSSGIQEFIEAMSFRHYLETQTLLRYSEAQAQIPYNVMLTEEDYALGLFDLSGELMRFAITSLATTGTLPGGRGDGDRTILGDLRLLRLLFESLDTTAGNGSGSPFKRDVEGKLEVLKQSVEKVEVAAYGMIIRGRERPKGWVPEVDKGVGERRGLENYQSGGEA
ncbi:MAG: hypothetical protein Q9164_006273 [Protoblastenia rupestris]